MQAAIALISTWSTQTSLLRLDVQMLTVNPSPQAAAALCVKGTNTCLASRLLLDQRHHHRGGNVQKKATAKTTAGRGPEQVGLKLFVDPAPDAAWLERTGMLAVVTGMQQQLTLGTQLHQRQACKLKYVQHVQPCLCVKQSPIGRYKDRDALAHVMHVVKHCTKLAFEEHMERYSPHYLLSELKSAPELYRRCVVGCQFGCTACLSPHLVRSKLC